MCSMMRWPGRARPRPPTHSVLSCAPNYPTSSDAELTAVELESNSCFIPSGSRRERKHFMCVWGWRGSNPCRPTHKSRRTKYLALPTVINAWLSSNKKYTGTRSEPGGVARCARGQPVCDSSMKEQRISSKNSEKKRKRPVHPSPFRLLFNSILGQLAMRLYQIFLG